MPETKSKKLKIGWFSFSCCEDSTIVFTELLNDNYDAWSKLLEFKHVRVLKKKNVLEDIDVSFIEGAATCAEHEEKIKEIRRVSKRVVAVGSCAVTGLPSGQRGQFDKDAQACIQYLIDRFEQNEKVKKISDVVDIDDQVAGCPMNEKKFLEVVQKYLKEFGIIKQE